MKKTNFETEKSAYKSRKQIAHELGISPRTLRRKLHQKKITLPSGLICLDDQERVLLALGHTKRLKSNAKNA